MKKILSSLVICMPMLSASPAFAYPSNSFQAHEARLHLAERDARGELEPAVELSQGKISYEASAEREKEKGNIENAKIILKALQLRVKRNMDFLRTKHIFYAQNPELSGDFKEELQRN